MSENEHPQVGEKINHFTVIDITTTRGYKRYDCQCDCGNARQGLKRNRFWTPNEPMKAHIKTCGRLCIIYKQNLIKRKTIHGHARTTDQPCHPFYEDWDRINQRCDNKNNPHYINYGGAGVKLYIPWAENYMSFLNECLAFPDPDVYPYYYNMESNSFSQSARDFYLWVKHEYSGIKEKEVLTANDVAVWAELTGKNRTWLRRWSVDRINNKLCDGTAGCYVPGNTRLIPQSYQSVNRECTLKINEKPAVDLARANNLRTSTVTSRIRAGRINPLSPLTCPSSIDLDKAAAKLIAAKQLVVHRDGRVVDAVRNVPLLPYFARDKAYLCVKLPDSSLKDSESPGSTVKYPNRPLNPMESTVFHAKNTIL